jgi:hypothetical protein
MTNFDEFENKLLEVANKSSDPDALLKATQALFTLRQLRDYKRTPVWPSVLTPIAALLAVFMTALTLSNQTQESRDRTQAAEDAQWTEVMKQISLKDASIQMGIFGIQGFFDSPRHGGQAREVASAMLPIADSKDTFEIVLKGLFRHTNDANQRDLIGIAKTISYNERDLFNGLKTSQVPPECPADDLIFFMNSADRCYPYKNGEENPLAKRAWLYSWEIDSMSDTLGKLWQRGAPAISPSKLDLSALVLENTDNLKNLNFSNSQLTGAVIHLSDLSGTKFDHAQLSGAIFHQILKFKGSTWTDANWWDADSISCGLSQHLAKNYWPDTADRRMSAHRLVANCTSDDE